MGCGGAGNTLEISLSKEMSCISLCKLYVSDCVVTDKVARFTLLFVFATVTFFAFGVRVTVNQSTNRTLLKT